MVFRLTFQVGENLFQRLFASPITAFIFFPIGC